MKAMSDKEDVNAVSQRIKQGSRGKNRSRPKYVECKYCGWKRKRPCDKCIAFGKECMKCGKANHLARVSRQENPSPKKERKERRIQATRNTASLSLVKAQKNNVDRSSFKSKILATMKAGGQLVYFQVDSGATCNVTSKNILPKERQVTPCTQV